MSGVESGGPGREEVVPNQMSRQPETQSGKKPDIREFHERAKTSGAYERGLKAGSPRLTEDRQRLMEAYFTTPASYNDLRPLAGGVTKERVRQYISDGLSQLWSFLPPELQKEYGLFLTDFEFPHKKYPHNKMKKPLR